ncbi:MAG: aminotransferase class I/II-fold pyridoxal phosphate-dependent enzyme [Lachnospiraceae bacterium]|nr:aminotransferase class I/II-fold pyridoxal phosphate-dependent enzyme [Lachnospiraceae bacterium]
MQGVILAAGVGSRLKELTGDRPISMIEVNNEPLLKRMLRQMDALGLDGITVVTGYKKEMPEELIREVSPEMKTPVSVVENPCYESTDACGSLFCAIKSLGSKAEEGIFLAESDGLYDDGLFSLMMETGAEDAVLTAPPRVWVDGPIMQTDEKGAVCRRILFENFYLEDPKTCIQAIHLYRISENGVKKVLLPYFEQGTEGASSVEEAVRNNDFLKKATVVDAYLACREVALVPCDAGRLPWYEINDLHDLDLAQSMFATGDDKLSRYLHRFGGYWRYDHMLDFCYLVNPFFPNERFMAEMTRHFERLLREYPSGMHINSLLAGKFFNMAEDYILVGNGTSELIKVLMEEELSGRVGVIYPTFEEYANRYDKDRLVPFLSKDTEFYYDADMLMNFYEDKGIDALLIVNPDNPSGNYLESSQILRLAEWGSKKGIRIIVDESFVDFACVKEAPTLLEQSLLAAWPNLIVLKSISKSYGVPGLRLGVLATGDLELIRRAKKEVAIWNINSFGEYFMQIMHAYRPDFEDAMERFKGVRERYLTKLRKVPGIHVYDTQANYVLCRVDAPIASRDLAARLLNESDILIKDLHGKNGFDGESYIRLSVKTDEENDAMVRELSRVMSEFE